MKEKKLSILEIEEQLDFICDSLEKIAKTEQFSEFEPLLFQDYLHLTQALTGIRYVLSLKGFKFFPGYDYNKI